MSALLWKYYLEDDVDKFRRLLANTAYNIHASRGHGGSSGNPNSFGSSPVGFATSPKSVMKNRKASGQNIHGGSSLTKVDLNGRDHAGLTILHRAASSTSENATSFALALLQHPMVDLYMQDAENGWTALHRAFYFGNIIVARAIIDRDNQDRKGAGGNPARAASVINLKDNEGNSPFDVYNATIARRSFPIFKEDEASDTSSQIGSDNGGVESNMDRVSAPYSLDGDEVFVFGSNKNFSLGFGDEDDRQHPERITLKRPAHLLFRFYHEYMETRIISGENSSSAKTTSTAKTVSEIPTLIQNRPLVIQDVALSKLHSAILTTDPESNLYMCGFGPGGRLGTGDEVTRFQYVCIEDGALAGKKVNKIALGQNHSLAILSDGSVCSWGTNTFGQLGYTLPRPALEDEIPVCTTPRQIFGPLKREVVIGVTASAIHSVAFTSTSLFCWGKNEGQLGLMGSDAKSLEVQSIPRKVAASLFKSQIVMVSAIPGATTCLLANHTVCVFTSYGYINVKYPLNEGFNNYYLRQAHHGSGAGRSNDSNHITHITSGGDTIAAISSRGDLYTVNVRRIDVNSDASTTNPSKIKGALSQPEPVWSLRKGHWDGVKSVGIAENGTVIVCTQAGAVWRQVKRNKAKDAFIISGDTSRRDYKFQRVPGLSNVTAVRSTTFGVYAAIRKDCDITKTQILIDEQQLWADVGSLLSLSEIGISKDHANSDGAVKSEPDIDTWEDSLVKVIIQSSDIETDIERYLLSRELEDQFDVDLCTTTSDIRIPVHGFMLTGRSSVMLDSFSEFRRMGISSLADTFVIEQDPAVSGRMRVIFQRLDFITLLNLVVYCYRDTIIDVWHHTRTHPKMAHRYRQVRIELMKLASQLKINHLEVAARQMVKPKRHLNQDLSHAIESSKFFEDADVKIELDGGELLAHSAILRQRCEFFDGLFNGRAAGIWLADRREEHSSLINIDLKHIEPDTFEIILRYLYADIGSEVFDGIVSSDIDEFSDLVIDVMGAANELMLDRLSQICQGLLGKFVNTRNISQLLNVIAPCAITDFKDTGLEYLCLQLESLLENHLLDDLDESLLFELNEVVQANQLNCLPFAKSGRAELELHEQYPELAGDIIEERQRRNRDVIFRATLRDDDTRLSSPYKLRVGSHDDILSASPGHERSRRKSKASRNAPFSPSIRPADSMADLMFDMDEDDHVTVTSPASSMPKLELPPRTKKEESINRESNDISTSVELANQQSPSPATPHAMSPTTPGEAVQGNMNKWSSPALPSAKLDMKAIMAQASSARTSNLSMSISAQKTQDAAAKPSTPKMSQKERKKQQHKAFQEDTSPRPDNLDSKPSSPWQTATVGQKVSLKSVLDEPGSSSVVPFPKLSSSPSPSQPLTPRRTASPDTRFAGQRKSASSSAIANDLKSSPARMSPPVKSQPLVKRAMPILPHSKSYPASSPKAEPSLQLSMADIIGQQRREQEVLKEAVAKRSLQEIQEEQAFQEWWDQESRRTQEQEASRAQNSIAAASKKDKGKGPMNGARGKGGRGRGRGRGGNEASRGRGGKIRDESASGGKMDVSTNASK